MTAKRLPDDCESSSELIAVGNLQEFFRDSLHAAMSHQKLAVRDHTEHYVVNLLTLFARADALYEQTEEGAGRAQQERRLKPLVVMLSEALEAPTPAARNRALQRLGDVSLFMAGFFAGSFARKLIDIDYHIAMGGRAYGALSEILTGPRAGALGPVFGELAEKFQPLVDALNEVSEMGHTHSDQDILRLYEIWIKTGSARAYGLLRQLGVEPAAAMGMGMGSGTDFRH